MWICFFSDTVCTHLFSIFKLIQNHAAFAEGRSSRVKFRAHAYIHTRTHLFLIVEINSDVFVYPTSLSLIPHTLAVDLESTLALLLSFV